jgi:hypothetical protein
MTCKERTNHLMTLNCTQDRFDSIFPDSVDATDKDDERQYFGKNRPHIIHPMVEV